MPLQPAKTLIRADKLDNVSYTDFADFVRAKANQLHNYFKSWGTDETEIIKTMVEIKVYGNGAGPAIAHYYQKLFGVDLYQEFCDEFPSRNVRTALNEANLIDK